jgi:hypothetical protein
VGGYRIVPTRELGAWRGFSVQCSVPVPAAGGILSRYVCMYYVNTTSPPSTNCVWKSVFNVM